MLKLMDMCQEMSPLSPLPHWCQNGKSHIITVAWQAWHSQCSWEYIYIWELELHPGISPTLIHTEKYDLCIWEYTLYILEYTLYIWEYN